MRFAARAVRYVVRCAYAGWGLHDMSQSGKVIKDGLNQLRKPRNQCCVACKQEIRYPSLFSWDAGQAYETLSPHIVCEDLDHALHIVHNKKISHIQVLKSSKCIAARAFCLRTDLGDRITFTLRTLKQCMLSFLHMRVYKFGSRWLVQVDGCPIGGPFSSVH